jgi:hypothetical protein
VNLAIYASELGKTLRGMQKSPSSLAKPLSNAGMAWHRKTLASPMRKAGTDKFVRLGVLVGRCNAGSGGSMTPLAAVGRDFEVQIFLERVLVIIASSSIESGDVKYGGRLEPLLQILRAATGWTT